MKCEKCQTETEEGEYLCGYCEADARNAIRRREKQTISISDFTPDLCENLLNLIELRAQISKMDNKQLVLEVLKTDAADFILVEEMMTRLYPEWMNE